jgi:hypothetical protein
LVCSDWTINPEDCKRKKIKWRYKKKEKNRESIPEKHLLVLLPCLRH